MRKVDIANTTGKFLAYLTVGCIAAVILAVPTLLIVLIIHFA